MPRGEPRGKQFGPDFGFAGLLGSLVFGALLFCALLFLALFGWFGFVSDFGTLHKVT